ncbi:hypothetical protein [uncultured Kocuria sp.]|uniref:hypothetical protein n=1 Tax=uncultured Kocuria sp. TaxID=259305 RepID=UPI002608035A|nr:hypothetical protein [uncultured Kocuria sp.]
MIRTTRTVVVASLALAALTGCGGAAAEARGAHTYEPLPPLSTATPTQSPAPQPTSPAAPTSSPAPSAEAAEASAGSAAGAGQPAQVAAPVGGTVGTSVPGQAPAVGQAPAAVAGPVSGGAPIQAMERTSTSTTTTTSTTLQAGLKLVVTCEGLCMLDDLAAPELAGQDGPFSEDLLRQALEEELSGQGGDQLRLTDELVEQLMQGQWDLAERDLEGGDEKLVFSSARK